MIYSAHFVPFTSPFRYDETIDDTRAFFEKNRNCSFSSYNFFERTVTRKSYKELFETKFFHTKKWRLIKEFQFMQNGVTTYRTLGIFESMHKVYENRAIRLGYPISSWRFGGLLTHPDLLNSCDFFLRNYFYNCCTVQSQNSEVLIVSIQKYTWVPTY